MQSSDMRVLRTILTTKHRLLSPTTTNPKRFSPPSLISLRPFPNPLSSRYSHSASSSQEDSSNVNTPSEDTRNHTPSWSRYGLISRDNSDDYDGEKNRIDSGDKVENGRVDEGAKEANTLIGTEKGGGSGGGISSKAGSKKKAKGKTNWVCSDCGYTSGQWWGVCRSCNASGTMKVFHEAKSSDGGKVSGFSVLEKAVGSWLSQPAGEVRPLRLTEVNRGLNHQEWRIPLSGHFGNEVSRVLGGGLVPGSLILVGGDPGVGKSTLLLQIAAMIAEGYDPRGATPVIYVSGEESVEQIVNRADRLGIKSELYLYSSTDIEDILEKSQNLSPRALVVDSIQTVYLKGVMGSAGGVAQVKECTSALLRYAKKTNTPVFLIGHVTKSGDIAGPRVLEHIVDVVLYMEGEKYSAHRMLRVVKNRFGSSDELGVFEMSQSGLQAVSNASEIFLSEQHLDSDYLAGLAVAVIMDGSRAFLIEIQALCVSGTTVSRHVNGIQQSRADMIISVLIKQVGLHLQENAVFLNVVSGLTVSETAGDLAIAAAICSSFLEFPIPNDIAFIGEIGLGGELRSVPRMDKRINTVAKLGYRSCIVPKAAEKAMGTEGFGKMKIVGCRNLKEVINTVFTKQ
ncbi:putative endopeptidase La [Senna tora]|uniref:Putative endopeptidase La n=1 Tax=Senna tora TaxID=362788 RepID=A0A835CID3_9FABA|nr:putative endopeptidase La [Senna tora]